MIDTKDIRRVMHWTQQELADHIGVDYHTVSRWENDHFKPSPLAVERLIQLQRAIIEGRVSPKMVEACQKRKALVDKWWTSIKSLFKGG